MSTPKKTHFIIGSRKSQLALTQTHHVQSLLQYHHPDFEFVIKTFTTTGDANLSQPLSTIGAKSLFTKELEVALDLGQVDFVVHSLKDMPTTLPNGMTIGAMVKREDPRDCIVLKLGHPPIQSLNDLPHGTIIGTSSVRRTAQLKRRFPHLIFKDVVRFLFFTYTFSLLFLSYSFSFIFFYIIYWTH